MAKPSAPQKSTNQALMLAAFVAIVGGAIAGGLSRTDFMRGFCVGLISAGAVVLGYAIVKQAD